MGEGVRTTMRGRVAVLAIDNPPANAISQRVLEALHAAVACALADERVKVLVLTGEGRLFSAGADVRELAGLAATEAWAYARRGQALADALADADKPTIAAINGRLALGGGWELALACHLRFAEEGAEVGSPEVLLGVSAGWGGTQRLPALVGRARALELLLTGRRVPAAEALSMGLINRLSAPGQALPEALSLAEELARLSAPALATVLRAVRVGADQGMVRGLEAEARGFAALCAGKDWREGLAAFLEKRTPSFGDR